MKCKCDGRETIGICKCVRNWRHFKEGDVYIFEYKPDETNCWLYYLTRNENGVLELCNWSFFDSMFEIIE